MPISKIADLKTKNRQCKIRNYFYEMLAVLVIEMNVGCKKKLISIPLLKLNLRTTNRNLLELFSK